MLWLSTPAAPSLARTLSQAASSVSGANTLSIKLYQRSPLTPFTSADTMRSVQIVSSTHDQLRASAPCVALTGTAGAFSDPFCSIAHLPSCPPSLGAALLSALFAAPRRCGTMRALTPAAPRTQRDRPLRSSHWAFWTSHPQPRRAPGTSRALPPRASGRLVAEPGFTQTPRRLATARRRIGFVFLQAIHSPPAAPHLASERRDHPAPRTTQLLSATCAVATRG